MRSIVFCVALATVVQCASGQDSRPMQGSPSTVISGQVVDEESRQPIQTATVSIWRDADGGLATGAITGEDGRFSIEGLRPGTYDVSVSFIGYATQRFEDITLEPGNLQVDLGRIEMAGDELLIDEVEVTAERDVVEIGLDRTVYNVRDDPSAVGGAAPEVLQNIPSVEVDVDGNVSLRGSQNVAIHMNGRPVPVSGEFLATFLQQIPASTIERIEVIPNPSAKYDPEGMSGIINIVTRQDVDRGFGGGINLGAGTDDRYNASGNLSYQRGKFQGFANYGFRYDSRVMSGFNFRENRYIEPYTFLEQDNSGERRFNSHMFGTTLDYNFTRRDRISLSTSIGNRGGGSDGRNLYRELGPNREIDSILERLNEADNDGLNTDVSLAFSRTIEASRHELTAEARFSRFRNESSELFNQNLIEGTQTPMWTQAPEQRTWLDDRNDRYSLQADYIHPFGEQMRVETGFKSDIRRLDNAFTSESRSDVDDPFEQDETLTNEFVFDEQVHAVYGIANRRFGAFEAQAGVRAEQAFTDFSLTSTGDAFDNDYFSVFPSAFLGFSISDAQRLRASYSKRINRPHTRVLNPFTSYEDPLNRREGNPRLSPEYTHAFELGYTRFSGATSFTFTPYFRRTVDVIRQFKTVDNEGVSVTTFRNMATSDSYGAETVLSFRLPGIVNAFASVSAYQVTTDGTNVDADVSSDAFGWSTRMNTTFTIRPGTDLQFFWFYRSPLEIERGRMSAFTMSTLALRQQLMGNRANLSIRVMDVFDTMGFRFETTGPNFYQESEREFQSRGVFVGFTYNFGQQPRQRNQRPREDAEMAPDTQPQID